MSQSSADPPRPLETHRDSLRLWANRRLSDRRIIDVDPSDLIQQTLLQAHRNLAGFRGVTDQELRAWLRAILSQKLAENARKQRRKHQVIPLDQRCSSSRSHWEILLTADDSTPSSRLSRAELRAWLDSALEQLPEDQGTALQLRYLDGLGVAQVAERMGRSAVSVTGLIYRGTQTLRSLLNANP